MKSNAAQDDRRAGAKVASEAVWVCLTGALGDLILTTPALALVRSSFPSAHIHGIVPSVLAELYPSLFDTTTPADNASVASLFGDEARNALTTHPVWRGARTAVLFEPAESALAAALGRAGHRVFRRDGYACMASTWFTPRAKKVQLTHGHN